MIMMVMRSTMAEITTPRMIPRLLSDDGAFVLEDGLIVTRGGVSVSTGGGTVISASEKKMIID